VRIANCKSEEGSILCENTVGKLVSPRVTEILLPTRLPRPQDTPVHMKLAWEERDRLRLQEFLDTYFEQTADWSHAVTDMQLSCQRGQPYSRLMVQGDFFVEAGWRMDHFALDCNGKPFLVAMDDDGNDDWSYRPLE